MRGCRPLTDYEISRLLSTVSDPIWLRERTLILIGLRTGMLLTSMLSLRVGDVAIAGEIQNRIRVRRGTTKGKRAGFDMPLHPQAGQALQDYIDTLSDPSPNAYLFPGRRPGTRLWKRRDGGRSSGHSDRGASWERRPRSAPTPSVKLLPD